MHLEPGLFLLLSWGACLVYWLVAARHTKRAKRRAPTLQRNLAYAGMLAAAALLWYPPDRRLPVVGLRVWPQTPLAAWIGIALCIAGVAFAIWARRTLADNWSADVQIKTDHALVTAGPYALVRHPIYAGISTALVGTWMTIGTLTGLLALCISFVALWRKLRLEEAFMSAQFPDAYPAYAARVKRLVPGLF